jgi:hypothetical protein
MIFIILYSCVLAYCDQLAKAQSWCETITAFSDSCVGQNRNCKMALMWAYVCQKYKFKQINHKFLVSGHSYLPNDADFDVVEQQLRKKTEIFTFKKWHKQIAKCCNTNPYKVVEMHADNFFLIHNLAELLNIRKVSEERQQVKWLSIQWLMVKLDEPAKLNCLHCSGGCCILQH